MNQRMLMAYAIATLSCALGDQTSGQDRRQPELQPQSNANGKADDGGELNAIRSSSQAFVEAFNRADAKAVAVLWAADGDYIDDAGRKFQGRAAIEKEYADFFQAHPGVKIRVVIDALRLVGKGAAVEDGRAVLEPAPAGAPTTTRYTAVHAKVDGQWLMSTVRDTRVERQTAYGNLADLEWLIGTWAAEEHGSKSKSVCRWIANKSFVERSYSVTRADGTTTSGVQLIGWNPSGGHVQSWNFSSDGGHAIGVWTPRESGWSVETRGVTGDGTSTAAVNRLTRLDDNAYVWQSVQRTVGDRSLPDTDEVVLKRQAK